MLKLLSDLVALALCRLEYAQVCSNTLNALDRHMESNVDVPQEHSTERRPRKRPRVRSYAVLPVQRPSSAQPDKAHQSRLANACAALLRHEGKPLRRR